MKPSLTNRQARLAQGQFYTPSALCDFMLALASQEAPPQRILEPACGAGIFLERAAALAREFNHTNLQLVGIEQNPAALEMAKKHLAVRELHAASMDLRQDLRQGDFLTFTPEILGNFDLIIGNPPYIRPEINTGATSRDKNNRSIVYRYLFQDYLEEFPNQAKLFSQKADLYQWFFIHAYGLLQPAGILAFVVSNSWLDSVFGQYFRHFLWHHFDWLYLVESACERWFPDAAIHPVIVILRKKEIPGKNTNNGPGCQWIRLHRPLPQLLPPVHQPNYWQALTTQVQNLSPQTGFHRQLLPTDLPWMQSMHCNLYLRAPKPLQELYGQYQLWKPLGALGTIRYPLKTGINQFFYLSAEQAAKWRIEPEFLIPVMRSSKKLKRLIVRPEALNEFLFCCPYRKAELERLGKHGALAYIQWGERQTARPRQKRTTATPWPQVTSVQHNQPAWHAQKKLPTAHLLCSRFIDQRFFFALCQGEFIEDQTFYGLTLHNPSQHPPALIAALLNSTVCCALLAFLGRASLGEGVLQFARCDLDQFPVPNPALYSSSEQSALMAAFQALAQIPVESWAATWNHPARVHLDHLVLRGLLAKKGQPAPTEDDVERLRQELAQSILQRLSERQQMARNRSANN
jgi:methylase of polypeptide subunit release factors